MIEQLTLSPTHTEVGLDQRQLYAIGLDYVRRLARNIWTDHNVHDPGITALELLAYALTDLTYRASLPIEDLVRGNAYFTAFTAGQLLPMTPLTAVDYRKLIVDVDGVNNAWIEAVELRYFADPASGDILRAKPNRPGIRDITVRGCYRIRIEYTDDKTTAAQQAAVNAAVLQRLHKNRNLCTDFVGVTAVERQPFLVCGEIELLPDADVDFVHSEVLRRVQEYLSPPIRRYTLAEMLHKRKGDGTALSVPDVFEGPRLTRGFIDSAELEKTELLTEIRLSDVFRIVMDIPGVRAVRDLIVNPEDAKEAAAASQNRWVVSVARGKAPTLNRVKSRIVYYKRNMPLRAAVPPPARVAVSQLSAEDVTVPGGTARDIKSYYSFQHHFPAVYGLGENPLPPTLGKVRLALAAQLRTYLLFFDQLMANYCAQLAQIGQLFSINPAAKATYFGQAVTELPEFGQIYGVPANPDAAIVATSVEAQIGEFIESDAERVDRRTRVLDHLIARFAERFHDVAQIMRSAFGATDESLIADKRAFLNDYPQLGQARGQAYNYTLTAAADSWDSLNISGLERRVARLLGIANLQRRNLTEVTVGPDAAVAGSAATQFGFTLTDRDTNRILLKEGIRLSTADLSRAQMLRAFELGQWNSSYVRGVKAGGISFFSIAAPDGEIVGTSVDFASAADMEAAIVALRTYLRLHYSREGLFVIENLLLRPEQAGDVSLHFCLDADCTDCGGDDPYSYRVHVVLPAYAGRFNNMDFRRFVEEVIREEMPAHVLPKICWISEPQMRIVQQAYRDWLAIRSGAVATNRAQKIKALVDALTNSKSVYPVEKLGECDSPLKSRFILGRAALGSKTDHD